jgi:hypothetical protein
MGGTSIIVQKTSIFSQTPQESIGIGSDAPKKKFPADGVKATTLQPRPNRSHVAHHESQTTESSTNDWLTHSVAHGFGYDRSAISLTANRSDSRTSMDTLGRMDWQVTGASGGGNE